MSERSRHEIHPLPGPLLVYLINEWGDAPRAEAGESHSPYPQVETLRALDPECWSRLGPVDTPMLVEAANRLYPIFRAKSGLECAELLNQLVRDTAMTPFLASDEWSVHEAWNSDRPELRLLASATLALIEQLRQDPDASRLGTCEGNDCVDVYVDQSPAGRRQFCSLTCQNRHRTRAYRARLRTDDGLHPRADGQRRASRAR